MKVGEKVLFVLISVCFRYNLGLKHDYRCGVDNSGTNIIKKIANVETYPWLGLLLYPVGNHFDLMKTTIIMITSRMALAAALDIDKYPKDDFRALARAVLGRNCSGPFINVIDYTFHPDFSKNRFNTLAIVQLDTQNAFQEIRPICPPPKGVINTQVYAMSLTQDCTSSMVRIYKMSYVDSSECKEFYRRTNLDITSLWPTYFACSRASHSGKCVWQGGTALVTRVNDRWKLLGLGVNGPGCEAPARFMDFGMYNQWLKQSLARIGTPAISRIGPNHIILRRTTDSVQRFGPCDKEETETEIFTDYSAILPEPPYIEQNGSVTYNLSLAANVDYSCVVIRVHSHRSEARTPSIRLRRWCANKPKLCDSFPFLQIDFSVEIKFTTNVIYEVNAYGRETKLVDVGQQRLYVNKLFYGSGIHIPRINYTAIFLFTPYLHTFVAGLYPLNEKFVADPHCHMYHEKNKL